MTFETIRLERSDALATLVLDRPATLNALSRQMVRELTTAITGLAAPGPERARCLLITGAGRGFSSGADLAEDVRASRGVPDLATTLGEGYNPLIRALAGLDIPVVAAVNGPAAGAGMSLALAADFVFAARSAFFLQAFVGIGLAPDAGSTWFLPRLIGPARATELMMLGERLPAEQAVSWGLIHRVVDDDTLLDEATAFGHRLAAGPTAAYGAIRRLARTAATGDLSAQLDREAEEQGRLGRTEDFLAGIKAFLERAKPRFSGR